MTPEKVAFYESLKDAAIEQQIKYGVPASLTLAQAWVEHGSYSKSTNNYFGIHDDDGYWRRNGGQTVVLKDHNQMAHFRVYTSLEQGIEDHSQFFFRKDSRYSAAHGISPTDEKYGEKWAMVICRAGYAERPKDDPDRYGNSLIREMRDYDLKKYDHQAIALAAQRGQTIGYMRGANGSMSQSATANAATVAVHPNGRYSMPIDSINGSLVMTSDFGHRNTGIAGASHEHNGLDLRAKNVPVMATEMNGKVIKAENDGNSKSGRHIKVEYERDGHKYTVSYCHLSSINVKEGDTVKAGQIIGVSGNSSYRDYVKDPKNPPLVPHLHLTVRKDGEYIDPKKYLAEIAVKGGIDTSLVSKAGNGQDLLAQYKAGVQPDDDSQKPELQQPQVQQNDMAMNQQPQQQQVSSPNGLLTYLFGDSAKELEKFGGLGSSGDLIADLIGLVFSGAIAVCALRNKTTTDEIQQGVEEQKESILEGPSAVIDRTLVAQAKTEGVNPKDARTLAEMNAEAGLADLDQERQQQRTISIS